jgi:ribosomal protein L37AE/L43A
MPLFGKKKPKDDKKAEKKEEHVICPHCYLDFTVERVQQAGGICPSCKGEIDLEKLPRARL